MSILDKIAGKIADIIEDICQDPPAPEPIKPPPPKRDPADKVTPNLYVGKIMEDGAIKCEVIEVHKTNIHVKILEIKWDRLGTYLDVGKTYPVFKHRGWGNGLEVWEIAPKHMKRSTSQVILQWEEGIGWVWDLDF